MVKFTPAIRFIENTIPQCQETKKHDILAQKLQVSRKPNTWVKNNHGEHICKHALLVNKIHWYVITHICI